MDVYKAHSNPKDIIISASEGLGSRELLQHQVLPKIEEPEDLIRFIHRYQLFNGNFAGGVSCLAGAFHIRQKLFMDKSVSVESLSDRSSRIASQIFYAAEDEYADRSYATRVTHRDLGQMTLVGVCNFFDIDLINFDRSYPLNAATKETLKIVDAGYCQERINEEDDLLRGLGFHIASELLADQEFNIIDKFIEEKFPSLKKFLKENKSSFGMDYYRWIEIHTYVESEHLERAFVAADMAVQFYSGNKSQRRVMEVILDGFLGFGDMQKYFFSQINEK